VVLRTPKGWTGPLQVDGQQVSGMFRSHQVPLSKTRSEPEHLAALEQWMRSYRPEELFDDGGRPVAELLELPPRGDRRMSANPKTNGGSVLVDLRLPDFRQYGVDVPRPGVQRHEPTRVLGGWVKDVVSANPDSFLLFGPDEIASNRLQDVFEVTGRRWGGLLEDGDDGSPVTVGSSRSCPSTCARACSRATCSPAGTGSTRRTRRSSTTTSRCSTSTPSGCRPATTSPGAGRSRR
jgi:xylulose-5-phosphate/fructose-6-phosphate phosphoketolase